MESKHSARASADEALAKRAYELYERRGRAHGHDLADWFQAERELTTTATAGTSIQSRHQGIPTGPTAQIAAADWTRERLAAFGVPLPGGNRLDRAKSLLEDINACRIVLTADDDASLERVNEAQWTIVEQYIISRSLGRPGRELSLQRLRKLEEMLSGADVANADRNPLARNTQFEMYAAAFFTMGDVGVTLAEPDLVFDYLGAPRGLAAKRVQSFRQAPRRAREAADQIAATGVPGVVALNVDVLLNRSPGGPGPESTLAERLEVVGEVERLMAERQEVMATMTFGRDCIWDFTGPRPAVELSHTIRFTVHPRAAGDEEAARSFFDRLNARIDERMENL
jgi:hypothetical protein